jgi:hypothetical protein
MGADEQTLNIPGAEQVTIPPKEQWPVSHIVEHIVSAKEEIRPGRIPDRPP